jgi:hypothetical protein
MIATKSLIYGFCHCEIVSSPSPLGFIHLEHRP